MKNMKNSVQNMLILVFIINQLKENIFAISFLFERQLNDVNFVILLIRVIVKKMGYVL